ncbi:unnamed protein product [Parnassius apollo]|uniref:(apollo) hypothetical protein n=1 Tax=Parnassius apollo TaxID=110799 RepID=A0A8S3XJS0_PARAO|nr:unnamed protein product [Parnassius apollo]
MNPRVIALIMLVACANALLGGLPSNASQTFDFVKFIEDSIKTIKDGGLDPYINDGDSYYTSLDYPWLGELTVIGYFHNFELIGLSDIIYDFNYEEDEFVIYIRFPRLESTIGLAALEAVYNGIPYEIQFAGRLAVNDFVITVRVKPGSTEPSDEDYKIAVGLGSIESKMKMFLGGNDISNNFNVFMETSVPYILRVYQKEPSNIITEIVLKLPEILEKFE